MSEVLEASQHLDGLALRPADPGYLEEIQGYNGIVEHRPALVVGARSVEDIAWAVRYAGRNGHSVAVMATGHGISRPADGVLVTTSRMDRVVIDAQASTATVQAGVRSSALVAAAAQHGLAPLNGSSPGAGVVGYTLGGGVPMLGRLHGYAADRVRSLQLVTADGEVRRLHRGGGDELFWAVLGGKDNFGIVAEIEIDLLPISVVNGGGLWFTDDAVPDAVRSYVAWAAQQPTRLSSSLLLMRLPDLEVIPEPIRGRFIAHVRLLHVGPAEEAEELIAPLRAAAPVTLDTFGEMSHGAVGSIHNDPEGPVVFEAANSLLSELDERGVETLLEQAGPQANPGYLVELRQLGGRLAERPRQGVVGRQDGHWVLYSGTPLYGGSREEAAAHQARLHEAMAAWSVGGVCHNFLSGAWVSQSRYESGFEADDMARLRRIKARVDPDNVFRVNFNIKPEST
jgi:FAD/FMN-containing dehydrogenase